MDLFPPEVIADFLPTGEHALRDGLVLRPLQLTDFDKSYVPLLAQLTAVGEISREAFEHRFRELQKARPVSYYIVVVENTRYAFRKHSRVKFEINYCIQDREHRGFCNSGDRVEDHPPVRVPWPHRGRRGGELDRWLISLIKGERLEFKDAGHRNAKLGRVMNELLVQLAKRLGVYKLSLECKPTLVPFYMRFGYNVDEGNLFMVQRFEDQK